MLISFEEMDWSLVSFLLLVGMGRGLWLLGSREGCNPTDSPLEYLFRVGRNMLLESCVSTEEIQSIAFSV